MDRLPENVLAHIFLRVAPQEVRNLRLVSSDWRTFVDRNVGIPIAISSSAKTLQEVGAGENIGEGNLVDDVEMIDVNDNLDEIMDEESEEIEIYDQVIDKNSLQPISIVTTCKIYECRIGSLAQNVVLPDFKYPELLKTLYLKGKMTSENFNNAIHFEHLLILELSIESLSNLEMSKLELFLPELQYMNIFLTRNTQDSKSTKALVENVTTLLENKKFQKLKQIDFHFFCFMSSLDSEIRNSFFKFLINHKKSLESIQVKFRLVEIVPEDNDIEMVRGEISKQTVRFSEPLGSIKNFHLSFKNIPRNEDDYFGLQSATWDDLTCHLDSLETYELNAFDEDWSEECNFESEVPTEFLPDKPELPKELILKNALTLRKLNISIKSWDRRDNILEFLDFQVFETCYNLIELSLVGQWVEDFVAFVEFSDNEIEDEKPMTTIIENLEKLPESLRVFKSSFILIQPDDILYLIDRDFLELHLKYFGYHGSFHTTGREFLSATTFTGDFSEVTFLTKCVENLENFLTEIKLIASDYMKLEGDDDRTTVLDAYLLRNCNNLKNFHLEGMQFESHFDLKLSEKGYEVMSQNLIIPSGINRVYYLPKSLEKLKLKNIFLKSHHLQYFLKKLSNLKTLDLEKIGQLKNCGVTPKTVQEILCTKRMNSFRVSEGLNWATWSKLKKDEAGATGLEKAYPQLGTVMKMQRRRDAIICLELNADKTNYKIN